MPKRQIQVLNQKTAKGTEYSCGFHAIKNGLLGLLVQQGKINDTTFQKLANNKAFFEALYDQVSPNKDNVTLDLSRAEVKAGFEKIKAGQVDLSAFNISNEDLTGLDFNQLTTFNIPFGYAEHHVGAFGDDTLANALQFVTLAQQQGPFSHVFALGGSFPPSYDGHWLNVYMEVNEQNQRSYTFMDSYNNQQQHFQLMVGGVEAVMAKDSQALESYLLDVYDAANFQFADIYNRFFDFDGELIPNDGILVDDPRHQGEMIPRGCFDDAAESGKHEWIDATEYGKRYGASWAGDVESKFNTLQSAGLLDNPSERTQVFITQLQNTASLIESIPTLDNSITDKMAQIRQTLSQAMPNQDLPPSSQLDDSQDQIIIKINSQPQVAPIGQQISNIKQQITKLEKSVDVSIQLIEQLSSKSSPQPHESRLLDKAQSGLMKKLAKLDTLMNNLKLAEAHQQKTLANDSSSQPLSKQQQMKQKLASLSQAQANEQQQQSLDIEMTKPSL